MTDELVGNWIGDLRGTDAGLVFATIAIVGEDHVVDVKLNVAGEVTNLVGTLQRNDDGAVLTLALANQDEANKGFASYATVTFETVSRDRLSGTWTTSNGHAGVVGLSRYETKQTPESNPVADPVVRPPAELIAREQQLPNVVLYRSELEVVVAKMKELVGGKADVVIAATEDNRQTKAFASDFFQKTSLPQSVTILNLSVNDGRQPLSSVVIVNLTDKFNSTFFVQSDNAIWVGGAFAEMDDLFRRYTNPLLTFIHKYGLTANGLALLAVIAFLPDLPFLWRVALLVSALVLFNLIAFMHRRLTSTRIHLDKSITRGFFSKVWPSLTSAIFAATILGFAAWAYTNVRWLLGLP
jgi:hypothetical protein